MANLGHHLQDEALRMVGELGNPLQPSNVSPQGPMGNVTVGPGNSSQGPNLMNLKDQENLKRLSSRGVDQRGVATPRETVYEGKPIDLEAARATSLNYLLQGNVLPSRPVEALNPDARQPEALQPLETLLPPGPGSLRPEVPPRGSPRRPSVQVPELTFNTPDSMPAEPLGFKPLPRVHS